MTLTIHVCPRRRKRINQRIEQAAIEKEEVPEARKFMRGALAAARGYYDRCLIPEWLTFVFKDRNIAWYAVNIGDQKPFPIEGVGVGWFDAGSLLAMAACSGPSWEPRSPSAHAMLTEPTRSALSVLLDRRCA